MQSRKQKIEEFNYKLLIGKIKFLDMSDTLPIMTKHLFELLLTQIDGGGKTDGWERKYALTCAQFYTLINAANLSIGNFQIDENNSIVDNKSLYRFPEEFNGFNN